MTTLHADGKVMIEVGLNESVRSAQCPQVPTTVAAVIQDVRDSAAAGAAVVHYHARDAAEADIWQEVDFYREVTEGLAAHGCDALTYPTYLGAFDHIWTLHDQVGTGLRMAPFDVIQNVGLCSWDEDNRAFVPMNLNALGADKSVTPPALAEIQRRGLGPVVAVFDVGQARWVRLAVRAGILHEPVNLKLFLHAGWVLGPTPSAAGLDAYLAELDGIDVEVTVVPSTMRDRTAWSALLDASLARGLNIRVGLGDCPAIHGERTNAALVGEAVELVAKHGLVPAAPPDVVARFGLAPLGPAPFDQANAERPDDDDHDLLTFGEAGARLGVEVRSARALLEELTAATPADPDAIAAARARLAALEEGFRRNTAQAINDDNFERFFGYPGKARRNTRSSP